jgi:hypothetical protein
VSADKTTYTATQRLERYSGQHGELRSESFKIEGTYGYDSGYAANASGVTVSPVTAQVYTYFLP